MVKPNVTEEFRVTDIRWTTALFGGMLIGLSATLLLAFNGRIAGISGIVNGALTFSHSQRWRWYFLLGLVLGGGLYEYSLAPQPTPLSSFAPWAMLLGGFLVGIGTRIGSGWSGTWNCIASVGRLESPAIFSSFCGRLTHRSAM